MVTSRLRPLLIIILVLVSLWFVIIYMCLPNTNLADQWSPEVQYSSGPLEFEQQTKWPSRHHEHHSPDQQQQQPTNTTTNDITHKMSSIDLLFHDFNLHTSQQEGNSVTQKDHQAETISLGKTRNQLDERAQIEGHKLFSFNLLISNRIGLFRSLPDSRHQKCPLNQANNSVPYLLHYKPKASNNHQSQTTTVSPTIDENTNTLLHHSHRLPKLKASIIICYYNEAPSALLRTIYTVLRRSPLQLVEEILVIDDFSNQDYISEKIKPFLETTALNYVSFHRTSKREGLIRARLFGVEKAKGDVLLFLDSHIEANVGWLEPLMIHLESNNKSIACPMIDIINADTFVYTSSPMVVGGLTWALHFKWDSVPAAMLTKQEDFVKPIKSPTMAGGLYAIHKSYFHEIGQYDPGMELWGGENVELSLRVWMCGGSIFVLPCSRVGHVFRKHRPYGPEPDQPDSLLYNTHRTARVWLDEYLQQFYEAAPDARYLDSGGVLNRLELRRQMDCNNFTWFIKEIYPGLRKPKVQRRHVSGNFEDRGNDIIGTNKYRAYDARHNVASQRLGYDPIASDKFSRLSMLNTNRRLVSSRLNQGHLDDSKATNEVVKFQIQLSTRELCIESRQSLLANSYGRLVLENCARQNTNNYSSESDLTAMIGRESANQKQLAGQLWTQTSYGDYRLGENRCLDLAKNLPLLTSCRQMGGLFQGWSHGKATNNVTVKNLRSGLCLGVERVRVGEPIIVTLCDSQQVETPQSNSTDHLSSSEDKNSEFKPVTSNKFEANQNQYQRQFNTIRGLNSDQYRRRPKDFLSKPLQISQRWNIVISQHQRKYSAHKNSQEPKDSQN